MSAEHARHGTARARRHRPSTAPVLRVARLTKRYQLPGTGSTGCAGPLAPP